MDMKPQQSNLRAHLKDAWIIPALALIAAAVVVGALALLKTPEYSSTIMILVVQRYTLTDSYTASKSAEKISDNLAEVITTSTFMGQVMASGQADLSELEGLSEKDKREVWAEKVETRVIPSTSMLEITAYDEDPGYAEGLAQAVSNTLIEHGSYYHGAPDTISLKVVDTALTSDTPTRPNLLTNGLAAALFGAMLGVVIVFLRPGVAFNVDKMKQTGGQTPSAGGGTPGAAGQTPDQYAVLDVSNYHRELTKVQDAGQQQPPVQQ